MAKETKKTTKKEEVKSKKDKVEIKKAVKADFSKSSLDELRLEAQRVALTIKTKEENDTSKLKKLKKEIARRLTQENLNKKSK